MSALRGKRSDGPSKTGSGDPDVDAEVATVDVAAENSVGEAPQDISKVRLSNTYSYNLKAQRPLLSISRIFRRRYSKTTSYAPPLSYQSRIRTGDTELCLENSNLYIPRFPRDTGTPLERIDLRDLGVKENRGAFGIRAGMKKPSIKDSWCFLMTVMVLSFGFLAAWKAERIFGGGRTTSSSLNSCPSDAVAIESRQKIATSFSSSLINDSSAIVFDNFRLECLPENAFSLLEEKDIALLQGITRLGFNGNGLYSISENPFVDPSLPSLTQFTISNNAIEDLPSRFFQAIKSVEKVDLRGNGLHQLNPEALKGCNSLETLILDDNPGLRAVPVAINELPELSRLSLFGCSSLRDFEEGLFTLANLEVLDVTDTLLTTIYSFDDFIAATGIDLELTEVLGFHNASSDN